ncbi:MAG: TlpA disulfide reductase family protein [Candidatus Sedimenticola sp. 6PFRAG7]
MQQFNIHIEGYPRLKDLQLWALQLGLVLLWALLSESSFASDSDEFAIALESDNEIPVTRFHSDGDRILWLPSEFGFRGVRELTLADGLAVHGFDVWLANLHEAYFLPPGRNSLRDIPIDDVAELIQRSQPESGRLFLMSTGRGAALSLMAVRRWQQLFSDRKPLGGLFLFHPNLMAKAPTPGSDPQYLPVADLTNQPILLLQPADSSKRWYLDELLEHLRNGGANVFTRVMRDVSDGFHLRPNASEKELEQSSGLPQILASAAPLLAGSNPAIKAPSVKTDTLQQKEWDASAFSGKLQPFKGNPTPPELALTDLKHEQYRLDGYRGNVVLLNFWATWCPPCVKEIPSLGRLKKKMQGRNVAVLSVDVGESIQRVEAFLKKIPADFPVLLDPEGSTVQEWKIRAFPTTFLIDQGGMIRYAYFGGLEWDSPEVIELIEQMLNETPE